MWMATMAWNGTTLEKHSRKSARSDAQADGWTAGVQDEFRSFILGRGFGLERLGIGIRAHALCERLRPLPCSAHPQPKGTAVPLGTLRIKVGQRCRRHA